jgi:TonB family protein
VRPADLEAEAFESVRPADLEAEAAEDAIDAASSADVLEAASADFEEVATPPRPPAVPPRGSPPPRPATGPVPTVPTNGVAVRPPTGPVPVVPPRPRTGPVGIAPAVATSAAQLPPVVQPELVDLREGTQKKRRPRSGTAIVRSRSRAPIVMYLALAAAAVAGFLAVVHFLPRATEKDAHETTPPPSGSATAVVEPAGSAAGSAETAGSDVAEAGSAEAGSAEPEIDIEPPPAHGTVRAPNPPTHAAAAHPTHVAATPAHEATQTHEATAPTHTPAETAKAEPPVDDNCDEVSCVLDKYARECCARFKPVDAAFHPKGSVPDALDKAMVHAGIEKVKPKVVACGEKIAVKGTVKLAITVAPAGTISDISVSDSPDAALGDCVLAAVKRATFGKSVNGASFTYPFAF